MGVSADPNANTLYVPFQPNGQTPFTFQPTFDGAVYNCAVRWVYYPQRQYLQCTDVSGALVYFIPLIASPDGYGINLNGGYFQTSCVFRSSSQQFEITPANPTVTPLVNPALASVTPA